jgi:hypothetical protein
MIQAVIQVGTWRLIEKVLGSRLRGHFFGSSLVNNYLVNELIV